MNKKTSTKNILYYYIFKFLNDDYEKFSNFKTSTIISTRHLRIKKYNNIKYF